MNYDWNFARLTQFRGAFLSGTVTTIELTALVVVIGTALGLLCGLMMREQLPRRILYPFVEVVRALPPLVLLLFVYYLLARDVIGFSIPAFWISVLALSVNLAAFTADLVRAALSSVSRTSVDAGRALGMTNGQLTRHIVIPHVLREIAPAMTLLYVAMLKATSLASVIFVREIVYTAETVIANVPRSLETWTIVGVIYIILVIPSAFFARRVEKWLGRAQFNPIEV